MQTQCEQVLHGGHQPHKWCFLIQLPIANNYLGTKVLYLMLNLVVIQFFGIVFVLFLIQNLHRYALYIAIFYIVILYVDAFMAFSRDGELGFGVGTIILLLNPTLLAFYTFGCHAFRHIIGGRKDCNTCEDGTAEGSFKIWEIVSKLNSNHRAWAWISMIWVGLTDVYIRLVSMGVIHDYNTW